MITKHFFKVLGLFVGMIIIGLVGVFLVAYFDKGGDQVNLSKPDCTSKDC
ncbi:MAG: hypothetical protein KGL67_00030 [Patescibacteria group bacterium]|nr:hypothetical protein [Patescibacteria group bacterium]